MRRIAYERLPTEQDNPRSRNLDRLSPLAIVSLMNREDRFVLAAVRRAGRPIARAVELITECLRHGGRLVFVGAGTSGRLGVLEAAECPPTFGTPPALVQAIMAGGRPSVFRSREGAEDREGEARRAIRRCVRAGDVVVGVSASGVTPFVRAALREARRRRARTVLVATNPLSPVGRHADLVIGPRVGPEILAGSTRLKAGSATKMILNMLTTASMVSLGKVYANRMVDLRPTSRKLRARAEKLIRELGGTSGARARRFLEAADGQVKVAILMARRRLSAREARRELARVGGSLRGGLGRG
ncbi:MAG: N-acetylmuramic acid 6-phosphate etherase [Candidatus Rokubacteria bacterium]|nr:N-acetylmuramic acid 6-phosphate etherase [Candidatus Rokubacteria bacterium]